MTKAARMNHASVTEDADLAAHSLHALNHLTGRSPSAWIARELPFIQGGDVLSVAS